MDIAPKDYRWEYQDFKHPGTMNGRLTDCSNLDHFQDNNCFKMRAGTTPFL